MTDRSAQARQATAADAARVSETSQTTAGRETSGAAAAVAGPSGGMAGPAGAEPGASDTTPGAPCVANPLSGDAGPSSGAAPAAGEDAPVGAGDEVVLEFVSEGTAAEEELAPVAGGLARRAGTVGMMTMISRVLGLVREQVFAALFGAGFESDAFNVAFRIPNLLRDLFAEGALSAAFVPTFSAVLATEGRERAFRLVDRVTGTLLATVLVAVVAMTLLADPLVHLIAPGFAAVPGKMELTVTMTRVLAPFLALIALAAVLMGTLNSLDRFAVPAFAPAMLNLGMIVAGTAFALAIRAAGGHAVVGMALGVLVGGVGQLVVQLPELWRAGHRPRPTLDPFDPGVRRILGLMAPATIGLAATQLNIMVSTWIASMLVQGAVSWLSYAFRLMQLPIGVLGVAVATVAVPSISRSIAVGRLDRARDEVSQGLQLTLALTVPASVALFVMASPIIALLYQHGRFTAADTHQTALALAWYSLGLAGFSAVKLLVPVWYALGETALPVRASMAAVATNIGLNVALMHSWGHQGLAMATSVTGLANALFVLWPLRRRLGGIGGRRLLDQTMRIGIASALMGVTLALLQPVTAGLVNGIAGRLLQVALTALGGVAVLGLAMELLAVEEGRHAIRIAAARCRRALGRA